MVEEFENLDDNCSEESEVKKEEEQDMFEELVKGISITFIFYFRETKPCSTSI